MTTHERPPILTMLVGVPGSGKSYFARNLAERTGAVRLSGDAMKTALFGSYETIQQQGLTQDANAAAYRGLDYATEAILTAGHDVIYDLNSNRLETRQKHRDVAQRFGALAVVVWMRTPDEVALMRAIGRSQQADHLQFTEEMWHQAVAIQQQHFDMPTRDEGLIKISGVQPFDAQLRKFDRKVKKFVPRT